MSRAPRALPSRLAAGGRCAVNVPLYQSRSPSLPRSFREAFCLPGRSLATDYPDVKERATHMDLATKSRTSPTISGAARPHRPGPGPARNQHPDGQGDGGDRAMVAAWRRHRADVAAGAGRRQLRPALLPARRDRAFGALLALRRRDAHAAHPHDRGDSGPARANQTRPAHRVSGAGLSPRRGGPPPRGRTAPGRFLDRAARPAAPRRPGADDRGGGRDHAARPRLPLQRDHSTRTR